MTDQEKLEILQQFTWEKYETDSEFHQKVNEMCRVPGAEDYSVSLVDIMRPYQQLYEAGIRNWMDLITKENGTTEKDINEEK
jgi:hypothetical protein